MPLPGQAEIKKHKHIRSRFNLLFRHGNVEEDHRKAFNRLSEELSKARYVKGKLELTTEEISKWKTNIEELLKHIRQSIL